MSLRDRQQRTRYEALTEDLKQAAILRAGSLVAALALQQRRRQYCDVLLQEESTASEPSSEAADHLRGVWAHRAVLAAASPYFYNIFYNKSQECSTKVVVLRKVKLNIQKMLVENIYAPATLAVTVENAKALLAAAIMLEVGSVRDAACSCLARALNAANALGIHAYAELHGCAVLVEAATNYISNNFEHVLQADELLSLAPDAMTALLAKDRLPAIEVHVLDAVLRWTLHQQERRRQLSSLLRAVRLWLVPQEVLAQRASAEPLFSEKSALLQILKVVAPDHSRPEHHVPSIAVEQPTEWSVAKPSPVDLSAEKVAGSPETQQSSTALIVMGGCFHLNITNTTLFCSLPDGRWQSTTNLPAPRCSASAALLDGRVYLVGGRDDDLSSLDTMFVFDAATDSWSTGPRMNRGRVGLAVATQAGRLYAAGGSIVRSCILDSMEALDPREGVWRPVASMATSRERFGFATLVGMLYAVGGYDGSTILNSVERYDPAANKWEAVEPLAQRRSGVGAAVVDDELYAVGGRDEDSPLRAVERYRPGWGWQSGSYMGEGRSAAAVTAHGDRLYVVGGAGSVFKPLSSVSSLEPATAAWSKLPALPEGRWAPAAVVVPWTPRPIEATDDTNRPTETCSTNTKYSLKDYICSVF